MPPKTVMLDQESVTAIAQALRHILTQDDTVKEKLTDIVEEVVHDKLQEHFTPHGGYDVSGHLVDSMAAGMGLDGPEGPAKELAALVGDALEPHLKTVTNAMNQMRTELAPGAPAGGPSGGKQRTDTSVKSYAQPSNLPSSSPHLPLICPLLPFPACGLTPLLCHPATGGARGSAMRALWSTSPRRPAWTWRRWRRSAALTLARW